MGEIRNSYLKIFDRASIDAVGIFYFLAVVVVTNKITVGPVNCTRWWPRLGIFGRKELLIAWIDFFLDYSMSSGLFGIHSRNFCKSSHMTRFKLFNLLEDTCTYRLCKFFFIFFYNTFILKATIFFYFQSYDCLEIMNGESLPLWKCTNRLIRSVLPWFNRRILVTHIWLLLMLAGQSRRMADDCWGKSSRKSGLIYQLGEGRQPMSRS